MSNQSPRIILDTNLWVSYLTNENPQTADSVQCLLENHPLHHRIIIPSIIMAETVGIVRGKSSTPDARKVRANETAQFFHYLVQKQACDVVDLNYLVASKAAEFSAEYDIRGADASILASAVMFKAQSLFTADKGLQKLNGLVDGLFIGPPPEPDHFII